MMPRHSRHVNPCVMVLVTTALSAIFIFVYVLTYVLL